MTVSNTFYFKGKLVKRKLKKKSPACTLDTVFPLPVRGLFTGLVRERM